MKNPAQDKWNNKYRDRKLGHKHQQPSDWLKSHENLLKRTTPGRALDIACGDGRNSFYLASLGFTVDAIDISDVAIKWLSQQVNDQGLSIKPIQGDLEEVSLREESYHVIVNFIYLQRGLFPSMIKWLKPGGYLFFETMNIDHIEQLKNSMNRDYVLEKNELILAFKELELIDHKELTVNTINSEQRSVSRLLARKPSYS